MQRKPLGTSMRSSRRPRPESGLKLTVNWPVIFITIFIMALAALVFFAKANMDKMDEAALNEAKTNGIFLGLTLGWLGVICAALAVYIILCGLTSSVANAKGYGSLTFFFYSLFCTPLIALIYVTLLPPKNTSGAQTRIAFNTSQPATSSQPPIADRRFPCPECGESIPVEAKFCRFCNAVISIKDKPKPKPFSAREPRN